MSAALEQLRRHPAMWRREAPPADGLSTGFPALDEVLPDAGWPMGALTEILVPRAGAGELRLVLPALARYEGPLARLGRAAPRALRAGAGGPGYRALPDPVGAR